MPTAATARVLVELRRPPLGERFAGARPGGAVQRDYVASLDGEVGALLGALRAKGVELGSVVRYARVWHGFAATVRTADMAKVQALGLRVEPVRRFYGALAGRSSAAARRAEPLKARPRGAGRPTVALIDSGVRRGAPGVGGRVVDGPDVSGGGSGGRHGTAVASVLASALAGRERILSIRVARREGDRGGSGPTESTTTDRLLSGLEHAVDPNGDGDSSDALPVALVGVNSPYAGFADAPEAKAVQAAAGLGTLVIAPAGNEGAGSGQSGTIGSPAAAPGALAIGALAGGRARPARVDLGVVSDRGRAVAAGTLLSGRLHAGQVPATTLAGPSTANPRGGPPAAGASSLEYLTVDARPKARRRLVVVPMRAPGGGSPPIADRAAAAAGAGAAALVLCSPDRSEPLAPLPAGVAPSLPVIGVSGDDAAALLRAADAQGAVAFVSGPRNRTAPPQSRPDRFSSRGPTYARAPKPDLVADGAARVPDSGGSSFESGTSIAAARVAAMAAELHRRRPALGPSELAAALVTAARPAGAALGAGSGQPDLSASSRAPVLPEGAPITFPIERPRRPWVARRDLIVSNTSRAPAVVRLRTAIDPRVHLAAFPSRFLMAPRSRARVVVTASGLLADALYATGTIGIYGTETPLKIPVAVPVERPPAPPVGPLRLVRRAGAVAGVSFAAGSVRRRAVGITVEPLRALTLVLVDSRGGVVRELTPVGGAPDVLPGEYSYTLPSEAARALHGRGYRFRVTATGPAGGVNSVESQPFDRP